MKIVILSSNISNEAGGYSESSFLLRDRLEKLNIMMFIYLVFGNLNFIN